MVLAYIDYFVLKASIQSLVYAIKLKLEFIVLNQLLDIVKHGIAPRGLHDADGPPVVEASESKASDSLVPSLRHVSLAFGRRKRATVRPHSVMGDKTTAVGFDERAERTLGVFRGLQTLTDEPVQHHSKIAGTSSRRTSDDHISPQQSDDRSFTYSEKRYLGQSGLRS